jgi:hypothetical protein
MARKIALSGLAIVAMVVAVLVLGAMAGRTEPLAEAAQSTDEALFSEMPSVDLAARIEAAQREEQTRLMERVGPSGQRVAVTESERRQRHEVRQVRRWVWESPAETRSKLWNVPETEDTLTVATGLLRICMTEADGHENDCIAIWQVLNNIRSSKCDRDRIRRITECDEDGETLLSVMRRAQKFALGVVPPRSQRTRWIAELELTCEQPESYPGSNSQWASQYVRRCGETSDLVQRLVAGQHVDPVIRGARAIAWGGRCESGTGACDDPLACARGLARIPNTNTANAFWCRPGSSGCASVIDPICHELGFRNRQQVSTSDTDVVPSS